MFLLYLLAAPSLLVASEPALAAASSIDKSAAKDEVVEEVESGG